MNLRDIQRLALLTCFVGLTAGNTHAQEPIPTPSEKMQEAVGKLNKAPATIGQSLQGLRDAAAAKLKQTLGAGAMPDSQSRSGRPRCAAKSCRNSSARLGFERSRS
jgi:hypothetical protein